MARAGGGVRGARALPTATALAPRHIAHTLAAQPSVFWHIDAVPAEGTRVVFALTDEGGIDPLIEADLPLPAAAGIQRLRLAPFDAGLAREHDYEWSISLLDPSNARAPGQVTVGYIRRVGSGSSASLSGAGADEYAARGLWYDALEAVSDEIDSAPGDFTPKLRRNALLRQGNLEIALEVVD